MRIKIFGFPPAVQEIVPPPLSFQRWTKQLSWLTFAKADICLSNLVFLPKDIRPWCPQSFGPELEKTWSDNAMILSRQNLPFFSYSFLFHMMLYSIFICINLPGQCHEGGERPQEVGRGWNKGQCALRECQLQKHQRGCLRQKLISSIIFWGKTV